MKDFYYLSLWGYGTCEALLESKITDEIINSHNEDPFDLIITEFFVTDCVLGIAYKLNVPFIGLSSCALMPWHYDRVGLLDTPSHIPSEFVGFSEKMNFYERTFNWATTRIIKILSKLMVINDDKLIRNKFGDGIPSVGEIAKNTSLILVNQHYSYSLPKQLPPQVIEIGGVHIRDEQPLPKDLKEFLDLSTDGVIYISWGSVVQTSSLHEDKRIAILKALAKFPQRVLWKWENESMPDKPDNVFIKKWMPQRDILCHPNVKVFMTHGGMLGTSEGVHCGVAMIVTPIYGDQWLNSKALEYREMAVIMNYEEISEKKLFDSLEQALGSKLQENAKKVSFSYKNRLETPLRTSLWWIEHTLSTNGSMLGQSYSVHMSWFTYYSLDVIFTILSVIIISSFIFIKLFKFCFCNSSKSKLKIQ